jgi:DNA invertase Pin-like site-specific DNA recombinase
MPENVAIYVRMSTESQTYSIENQKAALIVYAKDHGFEIIRSYEDPGKSGLTLKRRKGLRQLLRDVLSRRAPFHQVLVYDISRWGRFQDVDEAAHYEYLCRRAGIGVIYCAEQFINDGSLTSDLLKAIKRTMAGEYSRELSSKVARGQKRMASRGFWMHSRAPYGMRRMLVSPDGKQLGILSPGQHKFKTDRVILVPGPVEETKNVKAIFTRFLKRNRHHEFTCIAMELNERGFKYSTGGEWNRNNVRRLLTNPVYAGYNVWGRRTKTLGGDIVENPESDWTVRKNAFQAIISEATFETTQQVITTRWHRRTDAELLRALKKLYSDNGRLSREIILNQGIGGASTFGSRFGSLQSAYSLVGYEPARKRFLATASHSITWAELNSLANRICSIFPSRVQVCRSKQCESPLLKLDTGETMAILTCRSYSTNVNRLQWKACRKQIDATAPLVLMALFDRDNKSLATFFLVLSQSIPATFHKFRKDHPLIKTAVNLPDLFTLYESAQILLATSKPPISNFLKNASVA